MGSDIGKLNLNSSDNHEVENEVMGDGSSEHIELLKIISKP
jgi:hypothetical protein